ncbi:TPA: hypothetical protein SMP92_000403 [Pseudomonas putida]|nr:hypothetical protein [Pseudomonas putida]
MPQGLQIFNEDGSVKLDTSTLLGRVIGSVQVAAGQASGTIAHEQFSQGANRPFLTGLFGLGAFTGSVLAGPSFSQVTYTASGGMISWSRTTNQYDNLPAGTLYYGVF